MALLGTTGPGTLPNVETIVGTSALPEGSMAQIIPGSPSGNAYPGKCNPSAYITAQQEGGTVGAYGWVERINAWVNNNVVLAIGVIGIVYGVASGKFGKGK
jgi:hypothetical protein